MPAEVAPSKWKLEEFVNTFRDKLAPLTKQFFWLSSPPLAEEDLTHYLQDPIAALPPEICRQLPPIAVSGKGEQQGWRAGQLSGN